MNPKPPTGHAMEARELIAFWRTVSAPAKPLPTGVMPRTDPLPGIRAVIFDVYGTLFVSAAGEIGHAAKDDARLFELVLARQGLPPPSSAAADPMTIWRDCIRRAHAAARDRGIDFPEVDIRDIWRETIGILTGATDPAVLASNTAIERLALAYEAAANPVWPMPNARSTLSRLRAKGLLMGIVSNAQFFTPYLFDALLKTAPAQLGFNPQLCIWSYRMGVAKPAVRLFEELLKKAAECGIRQASELLYVGNDMLNDILTAHRAGLRTALFAGDRRSLRMREQDPRCREIRPDCIVTDLAQLTELIKA